MNKNTALLIVDTQQELFERNKSIYNEDILIRNINRLEYAARKAGRPVVYIQHESSGFLKKNTPGWQLHKGLNPHKGDLFVGKKEGNAFFETLLHDLLKERGITRVVVCGLLSQLCVRRTCFGALELGYETVVAADAHSNWSKYPEKTIADVNRKIAKSGGKDIRTEDIVF